MNTSLIEMIRAFNRFYLNKISVLSRFYLSSSFTLTEGRILYEINANDNCTASKIIEDLKLDQGYLSRIINKFERNNLITRKAVEIDCRKKILILTKKGRVVLDSLNNVANNQVSILIDKLSKENKLKMVRCMKTIENILSSNSTEDGITFRSEIKPGDIGYLIYLHGIIYSAECGYNYEFEGYVAETFNKFSQIYNPDKDLLLLAESKGEIIGSIAIVKHQDMAQLRWFLIQPEYRGMKLGKKLIERAMDFCKDKGYKKIFLYTGSDQQTAISIYKKYGFIEKSEQIKKTWGKEIVEKRMELTCK